MNKPKYDLNVILSNNLTIDYVMGLAGTTVTKTDTVVKQEFDKVHKSMIAGQIDYIVNKKEPIEVLSLFRPFSYKSKFHMSKFENTVLPREVIEEAFKNYLKESNAKIKDIFNWLMQSMSVINYNLIKAAVIAGGDTIKDKAETTEAWIKIIHKPPAKKASSSGGTPPPPPPPTYKYPALIKVDGQYLVYYQNGQASMYSKDVYISKKPTPPPLNKTFTEKDMEKIIIDNLVLKFHYLQYGSVVYNDGSEISVKERPYFYPPYGLQSSFLYNLTINTMRTKIMTKPKEVAKSFVSRYYYCYFHLCGVYFYKAFIKKEEYKIEPVDKEYFPHISKDFYKTKMPPDFSTTNKAVDVHIGKEKEELSKQGF